MYDNIFFAGDGNVSTLFRRYFILYPHKNCFHIIISFWWRWAVSNRRPIRLFYFTSNSYIVIYITIKIKFVNLNYGPPQRAIKPNIKYPNHSQAIHFKIVPVLVPNRLGLLYPGSPLCPTAFT